MIRAGNLVKQEGTSRSHKTVKAEEFCGFKKYVRCKRVAAPSLLCQEWQLGLRIGKQYQQSICGSLLLPISYSINVHAIEEVKFFTPKGLSPEVKYLLFSIT